MKKEPQKQSSQSWNISTIMLVILAILVLVNLFFTVQFSNAIVQKISTAAEQARPAQLELTRIENKACTDCFGSDAAMTLLKNANVNITKDTSLDYKDAVALIAQYNISYVPAVILKGEIDKAAVQNFQKQGDALVFSLPIAPYTDAKSGVVQGKVSVTILKDSTCKDCSNASKLIQQLKLAGVFIESMQDVDVTSANGKAVKDTYKVDKVPTIILSRDANVYPIVTKAWQQFGTIESDGSYVQRQVPAPYLDLKQNKIRGYVDVTYITDKSCTACYDIKMPKQILTSNQVAVQTEKVVDVNDQAGQQLVRQYKIIAVPAFIIQGDFDVYTGLSQAWPQVGTKEGSNVWVFRKPEVMNVAYKDLSTGKIVQPQNTQQDAPQNN